jgi:glycosyltransferase involved in cell wall biosynthesis
MRIFAPDMHQAFTRSLDDLCDFLGYQLLLPDPTFKSVIRYGNKYPNSKGFVNAQTISNQGLLEDPPDILLIPCYEQESDLIKLWKNIQNKGKTKLVYYAGNENVPYNYDYVKNIFCSDVKTHKQALSKGKNSIIYYPWIPFEMFPYSGGCSNNIVNSYICRYAKCFPEAYKLWEELIFTDYNRKYNLHETSNRNDLSRLMAGSSATLHVKPVEGFGYAIIESLSCGRPLIMCRQWMKNQTYLNWVIEGETAIIFDSIANFLDKINEFFDNSEYRFNLQSKSAQLIREKINNKEQSEKIKKFLEGLF